MPKYLSLFFLLVVNILSAQIFTCVDGISKFTSEAPLELIKAQSYKTKGVVDAKTKNVAFSVDMESFQGFNSGLQREHFMENYIETNKFPISTFKGKIIEDVNFAKNGLVNVRAKGIFNIHGVDQEKIVKVNINIKDKQIEIDSDFEIIIEEHNIKVPKIVNQKIASVISVQIKAILKSK